MLPSGGDARNPLQPISAKKYFLDLYFCWQEWHVFWVNLPQVRLGIAASTLQECLWSATSRSQSGRKGVYLIIMPLGHILEGPQASRAFANANLGCLYPSVYFDKSWRDVVSCSFTIFLSLPPFHHKPVCRSLITIKIHSTHFEE